MVKLPVGILTYQFKVCLCSNATEAHPRKPEVVAQFLECLPLMGKLDWVPRSQVQLWPEALSLLLSETLLFQLKQ